jgi:hypothetical protein
MSALPPDSDQTADIAGGPFRANFRHFVDPHSCPERETDSSRRFARDVRSTNSLPAFARDDRHDELRIFISLQCAFMLQRKSKKVIA